MLVGIEGGLEKVISLPNEMLLALQRRLTDLSV